MSQGTAQSSGVVVIDGSSIRYFVLQALDLSETIDLVNTMIQQIGTILTGLDGATNSPGAQTANIATLTTQRTQFVAKKDNLR
jgi:hypothetical protein